MTPTREYDCVILLMTRVHCQSTKTPIIHQVKAQFSRQRRNCFYNLSSSFPTNQTRKEAEAARASCLCKLCFQTILFWRCVSLFFGDGVHVGGGGTTGSICHFGLSLVQCLGVPRYPNTGEKTPSIIVTPFLCAPSVVKAGA